ncbi:MAG TPA: family 16 glycosylhydrolase [bacterium]|nr:family 16 glycosylhydrolase [bacterium]
MIKNPLSPGLALLAALALSLSCASPQGTWKHADAGPAGFDCDLRRPLDNALWESEPKQATQGPCGADPDLLETTPDGLRLVLCRRNWRRNSCAYGSLWSKHPLGYGTVSAVLKCPIEPGETAELLLLGDALSQDGPQKAIELRFLGKDLGGVQLRTLWDANSNDRDQGLSTWVKLGFDPGAGFHTWSIRWEPGRVTWSVDARTLATTTLAVPQRPLTLVLRHWVPDTGDPNETEDWNDTSSESILQYGALDRARWPTFTTVRALSFVPLQ